VPNGSERNAIAISAKLSPIATTVASVGQNLVSPSECFKPSAHPTSSRPAASNAIQPVTALSSATTQFGHPAHHRERRALDLPPVLDQRCHG
jgi:hypothetical protein